jgi:DNA invertase Pin-like site-specific DNA recombinase
MKQLRAAGAAKVFKETASGAKTDRVQLRRALDRLTKGDVLMVTRGDRLARSTRDLLNTLEAITRKGAGFRSLHDTWVDTTTPHGRLMLTVLGGLAEFERELIRAGHGRGACPRRGERRPAWPQADAHPIKSTRRSSASTPVRRRRAKLRAPAMSAGGRFGG